MFYYRKLLLLLMIVIAFPQITEASEAFDREYHRDWFSERAKDPTTIASCMCTKSNDGTALAVFFGRSNNCSVGYPAIIYPAGNAQNTGISKTVGVLRIDEGEYVELVYSVRILDGSVFIAVEGANGREVFKDAVDGKNVQFSVHVEGKGTRFLTTRSWGLLLHIKGRKTCAEALQRLNKSRRKKIKIFLKVERVCRRKRIRAKTPAIFKFLTHSH